MKKIVVLISAVTLSSTLFIPHDASAGSMAQRRQARVECRQQARAMHYAPYTVKWKNSIKECMIDRGFSGR